MESLKPSFLQLSPSIALPKPLKKRPSSTIVCCLRPDPWTLSSGNPENLNKTKPKSKHAKNPLSDDNARRIIKAKSRYLSVLRRNQGSQVQTPKWIKRTPEQMVQYLEDDRNGNLYGRHVVAAIKKVRSTSELRNGEYDMREVMASFVAKLSFREMCVVLKEQKSWRQVRDFFAWMKLQLSYRPSVIVYTILLRAYGQVGKIKLAEDTFLEMLEVGCQPDEVACGTMLCSYARWGRHKAMLSFYAAVEDRGIVLSPSVFNFMLSSLQKKSLHRDVLHVWQKMIDRKVTPNHFTYTVVIGSMVKGGMDEEAVKLFNEMKNIGFVPEESTYSLLISLRAKNGDKDVALRLYEDMRSLGIVPSNFTCASLLALYCRTADYALAHSLFVEMEKCGITADEVIYGLLIRIYGKLGLYEDAVKTFADISRSGQLSDEKTYTTMAEVHLNHGNIDNALGVINQMKHSNIPCSRFSYHLLFQCHSLKGDLASAESVYAAMSMSGNHDSTACKDLLALYIEHGLPEKAKAFIMQIRKDKVKFDEDLFMKVMTVYCNEGMLREVENLMDELRADKKIEAALCFRVFFVALDGHIGSLAQSEHLSDQFCTVAFDLIIILLLASQSEENEEKPKLELLLKTHFGESAGNRVLAKFAREGNLQNMELLYQLMKKFGCAINNSTKTMMMNSYGKEKMLKQAKEIFATVGDSDADRDVACNSLISAYLACKMEDQACMFFGEEIRRGQKLSPVSVSMLVKALITSGKYSVAREVILGCFTKDLELDTVAYNTCINAMLEAGKLRFAISIFERMCSSGNTPTIQTYNTMISVYGRRRNLNKAVEMFDLARSSGNPLDEKIYTNMIFHYGKAGKVDEALKLFTKMQEEGITLGQVGYNIIMNLYAATGMCEEAGKLLHKMHGEGCSPDSRTYLAIIKAYAHQHRCAEAKETIQLMQSKGFTVTCAHSNPLLSAYAKMGSMKEADRMYRNILDPNRETAHIMVRGYMEWGPVEEGIRFIESECQTSMEEDRFVSSAAVHLYASAGRNAEAEELLSRMKMWELKFISGLKVQGSPVVRIPV